MKNSNNTFYSYIYVYMHIINYLGLTCCMHSNNRKQKVSDRGREKDRRNGINSKLNSFEKRIEWLIPFLYGQKTSWVTKLWLVSVKIVRKLGIISETVFGILRITFTNESRLEVDLNWQMACGFFCHALACSFRINCLTFEWITDFCSFTDQIR